MAPPPVGQGSKEPARGGVLGVSSATSFFLEFPLIKIYPSPAGPVPPVSISIPAHEALDVASDACGGGGLFEAAENGRLGGGLVVRVDENLSVLRSSERRLGELVDLGLGRAGDVHSDVDFATRYWTPVDTVELLHAEHFQVLVVEGLGERRRG